MPTKLQRQRLQNPAKYLRGQNKRRRDRRYYLQHREKILSCVKRYAENHTQEIEAYKRKYYADNETQVKRRSEEYRLSHVEHIRLRERNRRKTDLNHAIACRLRHRLLKKLASRKNRSALELLGCSIEFLRNYLKSKFTGGMSWENRSLWHIDHIKPLVSFNLQDPEQQKIAFHYTNLQPLWAEDNRSKGSKTTWQNSSSLGPVERDVISPPP